MSISDVQLFAVTPEGLQPLRAPASASSIHEVFDGLPLGVYSALRTFDHDRFFALEEHFARMERNMQRLGWTEKLDRVALRRALHAGVSSYPHPDARVRFDLLAGPATALGTSSRLLIAVSPHEPVPEDFLRRGVAVLIAEDLRRDEPEIKRADFVVRRRPYPMGTRDAYEHLMVDDHGCILEGSSSNVFFVRGGTLLTAETDVLEGITRRIILQLCGDLGIPVRMERMSVADLDRADEAFLSSSARGIVPIVQVGDTIIGEGVPGPITRRILDAYYDLAAREARPALET